MALTEKDVKALANARYTRGVYKWFIISLIVLLVVVVGIAFGWRMNEEPVRSVYVLPSGGVLEIREGLVTVDGETLVRSERIGATVVWGPTAVLAGFAVVWGAWWFIKMRRGDKWVKRVVEDWKETGEITDELAK